MILRWVFLELFAIRNHCILVLLTDVTPSTSVAVTWHFHEGDGQLLGLDVQLLAQYFRDRILPPGVFVPARPRHRVAATCAMAESRRHLSTDLPPRCPVALIRLEESDCRLQARRSPASNAPTALKRPHAHLIVRCSLASCRMMKSSQCQVGNGVFSALSIIDAIRHEIGQRLEQMAMHMKIVQTFWWGFADGQHLHGHYGVLVS